MFLTRLDVPTAVSERESCEDAAKSPVCDTDGEEHANLCHLLRTGKVLAYTGPCLVRNARRLAATEKRF